MIIYKFIDKNGTFIEINFCQEGLYVKIDEEDSDMYSMRNIVIDEDGLQELKRYLNGQTGKE